MYKNYLSFSELIERFSEESSIVKAKETVCNERNILRRFSKANPEVRDLSDLSQDLLKNYLYHTSFERKWSPSTFRNYFKAFRAFSKWCQKYKFIDIDVTADIEKPPLSKTLPKSLSENEAVRVMQVVTNMKYTYKFEKYRNRALFAVLLFAGLRIKECLSLTLEDVNLDSGIIRVLNSKWRKSRLVPINIRLGSILNEYLRERKRLEKTHVYFFSSTNRDMNINYRAVSRLFKRVREQAGLEQLGPHRLRHTFATLMLENNCDLFTLKELLGHSDIKTTAIYLSTTTRHLKREINKNPLSRLV
jgi:site-specific recombinase XerD